MSGHSKWATIKHKKGAVDKARGKLFNKLARQLEVAARAGGGDPDSNPTLRTAVQKAKAAQMTNDAIDRAIKRGTGEGDAGTYEAITYEGYAPGRRGDADRRAHRQPQPHRRRDPRRLHQARRLDGRARRGRAGSSPAAGIVLVDGAADEDELMLAALEAGADDVADDGGTWRVTSRSVADVRRARRPRGRRRSRSSRPTRRWCRRTSCRSPTVEDAKKVLRIVEAIEDNDDVQDVFANFDIADDVMDRSMEAGRERRGGRPGARLHAPGHAAGGEYSLADYRRPAGGARLLSGRRHAGVHQAAQRLQRRARRSSPTSAPRCWRSRPRTSTATSASRPSTAFDFPLLADTDKAVAGAVRHARPDRLPPAQRVHRRRRRRGPLRPPGDRRPDVPPGRASWSPPSAAA